MPQDPETMLVTPSDYKGLQAARRYAQWHIGDRSWADAILLAYLNPDRANAELDKEMD